MFVFFSKEYSQACTLGLLSLCLHAWSSVVTSPPGDTASLNCLYSTNSSSDGSSMLWYRQLPGRPPELILQSFSPDDTFSYSYLRAGEHFTLEKNHTLVIRNVTRDDVATYYCSKLETDKCRFGDGIELRVDGRGSPHLAPAKGSEALLYVFLALSVLFNILLFLYIATEKKWFSFRNPKKTELQQPCHENDLHYAEVSTMENQQRRGQMNKHTVYAEVQLRK
ncbi:uncharacterized protein LOC114641105 [Erpetoichthys calabaricus]|uniref:uncharacterized protein LOC114641105 n=1 Tax=Erpetoichthys calabaricus TaxID=27687 RepID=UPI0010A03E3E|nr:uncharacterized protein LOC114641105 [Erpetoichthys calabaricus]